MELKKVVDYLDGFLDLVSFEDASKNGLQVENSGRVTKIGLAVDASLEAFVAAAAAGCDLLIVHHGLFWGQETTLTGPHYRRIRALIDGDVALYAAHLPLDAHPEVGNNAVVAKALNLTGLEPCGSYHGMEIGILGRLRKAAPREDVVAKVEAMVGSQGRALLFGPERVRSVLIVTGSASEPGFLPEICRIDPDLYVTGEPKHTAYHFIREYGLNVFYGGHYATEGFGLKALGERIEEKFGVPNLFLDIPTGL
ncbi:Nif3-like dinuclear metal center hexameric protein [Thermodesulfobacteriota bacterium]